MDFKVGDWIIILDVTNNGYIADYGLKYDVPYKIERLDGDGDIWMKSCCVAPRCCIRFKKFSKLEKLIYGVK